MSKAILAGPISAVDKTQIFISGEWVDSCGDGRLTVTCPFTEEPIATVPNGASDDVERAVQAAARAFDDWSRTSIEARAESIDGIRRGIESRRDEITRTIVSEVGQPWSEAAKRQVDSAIKDLELASSSLSEIAWSEKIGDGVVRRVPAGVVAAISPWNAPLKTIVIKAAAALAAGCTVVLKGTEVAPLSSFIFAEAVAEAGLPPGVFNLVSGTGVDVGEALASHALVDMVSLTGSVRAGKRVMALASNTVKRIALELGGKSANVILEDGNVESGIVVGIEDAFRNSGQVCGGLSRTLVPRSRLVEAEELAVATAESFVLGDPFDEATTLGPVISARQRERIREYIGIGVNEGARLLTGGAEPPSGLNRGYFVRPTIFTADNAKRVAREEIFGPVHVIIPYDNESEALAIANDSDYGLAGAVWAADPDRARTFASRIRTGRVRINGAPLDQRLPHGGFKLSGLGREWGRFGVEEYLDYQSIVG